MTSLVVSYIDNEHEAYWKATETHGYDHTKKERELAKNCLNYGMFTGALYGGFAAGIAIILFA